MLATARLGHRAIYLAYSKALSTLRPISATSWGPMLDRKISRFTATFFHTAGGVASSFQMLQNWYTSSHYDSFDYMPRASRPEKQVGSTRITGFFREEPGFYTCYPE